MRMTELEGVLQGIGPVPNFTEKVSDLLVITQ